MLKMSSDGWIMNPKVLKKAICVKRDIENYFLSGPIRITRWYMLEHIERLTSGNALAIFSNQHLLYMLEALMQRGSESHGFRAR